jgi:excisionase family DNA binding protein
MLLLDIPYQTTAQSRSLAAYLKLNQVTVCKYAEDGTIPAIRVGKAWRFHKETIDKWISEGGKGKKKAPVKRRKPRKSRAKSSKKVEKR